jgi:endogenous inhibitor of DNA gyrase (YacG/DUF329 family)
MTEPSSANRRVPCPTCKRPALYGPVNKWRPFCSERCRSADLGAWASEQFRVAAPPSADELNDGNGPPPRQPV